MIKTKIVEIINSYNKLPGEFTKDEIYEIGVKHKNLSKSERDWNLVAEMIGWTGSSEALRCWVNSRMRKEGILPKNIREINSRTIEDVTTDDFVEATRQLKIQQIKTRDEWAVNNRLLREEARVQNFIELLIDRIEKQPKLEKYKFHEYIKQNKLDLEAILLLSDLHIGVDCENFYNKYNSKIAAERLDILADEVIKYCHGNNVSVLNVCNLGDMIHGIIHVTSRIEEEMNVIDQIITASELLAHFLNKLDGYIETVIYRSVTDNHARVVANIKESVEEENFSKLIDWYLESRLKDTDIIFANDNIDVGIGKFTLENGKVVMFAHGHNDVQNAAVQNYICATKEYVDYILFGHFHKVNTKNFQNTFVFTNGSVSGVDQYALSKRLFCDPMQKLLIFDERAVIDININLKSE